MIVLVRDSDGKELSCLFAAPLNLLCSKLQL